MAGMNDDQVLAVMGVRAVTVGGDNAAHQAVVEGEAVEVLGDQDDRIALALIRAEGPRRHDLAMLEAKGAAQIVELWHEGTVA